MLKIFKKLLPFQQTQAQKPLHSGEIYHIWEGLTGGYKLVAMAETYLMNTEDIELQLLLKALTTGAFLFKIKKLEDALKNEGFTVPPRPSSKLHQGAPGAGQEVNLTDRDIIKNIVSLGQVYIIFNARAVMSSTRDSIRNLFRDLMGEHLIAYKTFIKLGKQRNSFTPPPPATARPNSLNMSEVGIVWDELTARHMSQTNLEIYLASTKDKDLVDLLKWGLNNIVMPQMEKLENVLKDNGITVPSRPPILSHQYKSGQVNKIRSSDDETLGILTLAFQAGIILHGRALMTVLRDDLLDLFENFIYKEFNAYDKTIALAKSRYVLDNPPLVSSYRI